MIKLIISDMDGTLLNSRHELPKDFMCVFEQLRQRGIYFCAASGRQYLSLLQFFDPIKDDMAFISENGAFVNVNGKEVYQNAISPYYIQQVLERYRQFTGMAVGLCGKKATYLFPTTPYAEEQVRIYHHTVVKVTDLSEIEDDIFQITLLDPRGAREHSFPAFSSFSQEGLKVTISGAYWIDITNAGVNKGVAVTALQESLGITPDETMAFGDYLNDLELLARATYSYAMKNAQEEVKQVATYQTEEDNDHDGVLKTIVRELKINLDS